MPGTPGGAMNVLVVGAGGGTGRRCVAGLLERGHAVRALVHRAEGPPSPHPHLERLVGDALDRASLDAAMAGREAVVSLLGPVRGAPPDLCARGATHLVAAMRAAGARRLVHVSGAMVGHPRDRIGWLYRAMERAFAGSLGALLRDRRAAESIVMNSGLDWTVVRPPRLTDGPARGVWRAGEAIRLSSLAAIARADLAAFLIAALEDPAWVGRAVAIAR